MMNSRVNELPFSQIPTQQSSERLHPKKRAEQMNQGGFLGRKLGLPHEAARALSFGANFFSFLKHHFDLVDCSAFWNLEFISPQLNDKRYKRRC